MLYTAGTKFVNQKGGLKGLDFWKRIFDEAIEEGMLFCLLTGGEIFTYPYFKELYEYLCTKGIHIVLNTNATLLDEETVAWLAEHRPRRLNISLYGASADTYENLCKNRGGFEQVLKAFELLNKYGIDYKVHGVLVPSNINDYEGIKKICNHFRTYLSLSYYMFPNLRKEGEDISAEERFTPEEMAEIALKYRKDQCAGNPEMWRKYLEEKCYCMEHSEKMPAYGRNKINCRGGSCSFWVNWRGEISSCGMDDDRNYDLNQYSLKEAWEKIAIGTKEVELSKECAVCKYRSICPVCAASAICETGRVDGTPKYLCDFCEKFSVLLKDEWQKEKKV